MVRKKRYVMPLCFMFVAVLIAGVFSGREAKKPELWNVFDEMLWENYSLMEQAEHVMAGGCDALRLTFPLKEGTPMRIGLVYSQEYGKLYLYGDAGTPQEERGISCQEDFEECLEKYGMTWGEVEDCKEEFICRNILGEWFRQHESIFDRDRLGKLEVVDYLMPYEYCGKEYSEQKVIMEAVEEGYRGAFTGSIEYAEWKTGFKELRCIQQSRDYGYRDIMERIEADINGFPTMGEKFRVEWGEKYVLLTACIGVDERSLYRDFTGWLRTCGKARGNLTKLSYTREEGEEKTREMLKHYPFGVLEEAEYYLDEEELHIFLPYYEYDERTGEGKWLENGTGDLWQGWISVRLEDIGEFLKVETW